MLMGCFMSHLVENVTCWRTQKQWQPTISNVTCQSNVRPQISKLCILYLFLFFFFSFHLKKDLCTYVSTVYTVHIFWNATLTVTYSLCDSWFTFSSHRITSYSHRQNDWNECRNQTNFSSSYISKQCCQRESVGVKPIFNRWLH